MIEYDKPTHRKTVSNGGKNTKMQHQITEKYVYSEQNTVTLEVFGNSAVIKELSEDWNAKNDLNGN